MNSLRIGLPMMLSLFLASGPALIAGSSKPLPANDGTGRDQRAGDFQRAEQEALNRKLTMERFQREKDRVLDQMVAAEKEIGRAHV